MCRVLYNDVDFDYVLSYILVEFYPFRHSIY
jgi:hypothetical protein